MFCLVYGPYTQPDEIEQKLSSPRKSEESLVRTKSSEKCGILLGKCPWKQLFKNEAILKMMANRHGKMWNAILKTKQQYAMQETIELNRDDNN